MTHVEPRLQEIGWWFREGLTEEEVCKRLGIGRTAFNDYKNEFPVLTNTIKEAKEDADFRAEDCLYQRVTGFEYEEKTRELVQGGRLAVTKVVTKQLVPDVGACMAWLKNRKTGKWRDKHEVEHDHKGAVEINVIQTFGDQGAGVKDQSNDTV